MKTLLGLIVSVLLVTSMIVVVDSQTPASLQKIKVSVASYVTLDDFGVWLGKEKGFYAAKGLDPELIYVDTPYNPAALEADQIDLAPWFETGMIEAIEKGLSFKVVMVAANWWTVSIMVQNSVKTADDINGKTIATNTIDSFPQFLVEETVAKYNAKHGKNVKVNFVGLGQGSKRLAAMIRGDVEGGIMSSPMDSVALRAPYKFRILWQDGDLPPVPATAYFVKTSRLSDPKFRDVVQRFVNVTLETHAWMMRPENKEETKKIMARLIELDKSSKRFSLSEEQQAEIAEELYNRMVKSLSRTGCVSRATMKDALKLILRKNVSDPWKFVDHSFLSCWS